MHIDFILQSNVTLLVFDVSHIVRNDSVGTWPVILLLEHEIRKRERRHFVIFLSLRTHGNCFYSVYFNLLLYSVFLIFSNTGFCLLSLNIPWKNVFLIPRKLCFMYVSFCSSTQSSYEFSAKADSCDLLCLFTKSFVAVANLHTNLCAACGVHSKTRGQNFIQQRLPQAVWYLQSRNKLCLVGLCFLFTLSIVQYCIMC